MSKTATLETFKTYSEVVMSKHEDYLEECRQEGGASGLIRAVYGSDIGGHARSNAEFLDRFGDILPHDKCEQWYCAIRWRLHRGVAALMYSLPPKEAYVIKARFRLTWIGARKGIVRNIDGIYTHEQIAERLKATPGTIAKYENKALNRLRLSHNRHILEPTLEDVEVKLAGRTVGAEMFDNPPINSDTWEP